MTADAVPQTLYKIQNPPHAPSSYKVPDGTGGGYWIASSSKSGSTSKPFIARSTYSHELCEPRVRGGVVRPAQPSRPATRMDAAGAAPARLDDVSRYERDFGADPLARAPPPNAAGIGAGLSQRATTSDLNLGTTRATRHVPGYAGFVAAAPHNHAALDHSDGVLTRPSLKDAMLLRALDQYGRGLTPGQTLWRPQHPKNVRPAPPPTTATTTGAANARTLRDGTPAPVTGHGSDDKTGVMSFFTAGVETVSDNGKTNAQQYFAHVRPFEGRASGYYPSRTTLRGSKFAE